MTLDPRAPILLADTGPLIRLAAAGLLDGLRLTNRRIVVVDQVAAEATGDLAKPYAAEIAGWLVAMGEAVERPRTLIGRGLQALAAEPPGEARDRALKRALRDAGEKALREYVETWAAEDTPSALVLFEDAGVPRLFQETPTPIVLMNTSRFVRALGEWGLNEDVDAALARIAARFSLGAPTYAEIDPAIPPDLRRSPAEDPP